MYILLGTPSILNVLYNSDVFLQGDALCKECFYSAFEEEVHHTITTARLFSPGDRVAVGASGGKGLNCNLIYKIYIILEINPKTLHFVVGN